MAAMTRMQSLGREGGAMVWLLYCLAFWHECETETLTSEFLQAAQSPRTGDCARERVKLSPRLP
ncbi:hypothetical protein GCM10027287_26870 [Bordetella muralis]